ncbi:hypothetical protein GLOIN_2v1824527 [Rhizophagus irregularis DAOM 181602=DAOM 197198]|nr:hypothetical protein GLOIN_2v1824527 [Rhizophagus irregularis DAOM 181602=DAOM 197198]
MKEETGYNLYEEKIIDKNKIKDKEIIEISINVTAFMDDTTLISKNKKQLEKMIEICHQFFNINDIKANVSKYELIKINNDKEDLSIEGELITKTNSEEGNRYLEIFFRYDNKREIYKKKITSIINNTCNIFNWKRLNEKQIIAVWNIVIVPRIEYQLAAIVLKKWECEKLMTRINMIIKKRAGLARSTPNFIIYDKDILGIKHIYDLQMEMICKNLLYQANGNYKLQILFKIKMIQEQKNIWTSRCPGELEIINYRKNNWIISALKALNNEKIKLCNHEIKDFRESHRIKGGKTDLIELMERKDFITSIQSRKTKNIMFLEDILEVDGITLLKWKHLCKERGKNTKGKMPKWFKKLELKLIADESRQVRKIRNEFIGQAQKENIHINYFDEDEKSDKNSIVTWNDYEEYPIFSINKKKSQSKKYKKIGIHLELVGDSYDLNNSPQLKKCQGCYRNISKKKGSKECLIYIENEICRNLDRRKEEDYIKPYETLNNIIKKNEWLRTYTKEDKKDESFNNKIEIIDKIIKTNEKNFLDIIKNSIFEEEDNLILITKRRFCLLIDTNKKKWEINNKGKRVYRYNVIWKIFELNYEEKESEELILLASYECNDENEFKIILRCIIIGIMIISENSELILGINEKVNRLIIEFINNFSNRKKIDSDYYLELLFLENFLETNNIELIEGGFRAWRKAVTLAIWKNEILNSERLEDLFMYNYRNEFDWITSLEFISNRVKFSQRQCGDKDTIERSYRIKNLLKELPTYNILFKRNTNKIDTDKCKRCGEIFTEDWEHIWISNSNQSEELEILRNYNCEFINIIESPSNILLRKNRKWELLRGIYNNKFNDLSKEKKDRDLIKKLWMFTYDEIKKRIWIPRCEEIKRLEKREQIKKIDLRRKRDVKDNILEDDTDTDTIPEKIKKQKTKENLVKTEKNTNINKQISLVTLDKMKGLITEGINITKSWNTTIKLTNALV